MRYRIIATLFFLFQLLGISYAGENFHIWKKWGNGRDRVVVTPYIPESVTPTSAVIVCPGGSYFWLDKKREGHDVAKWLCENGIAAFVLEYRVAGKVEFVFGTRLLYGGNRFPRMLQDVQRTIQLLREEPEKYNIHPDRVGVIGFSAGGHLAMLSAQLCGPEYLEKEGVSTDVSLKPDFVASIYPVVTFTNKPYIHKRSRRAILGEAVKEDGDIARKLSLEHHVSEDCCPVFLLNCRDDNVVHYYNSVLLDSALTEKGVNHLYLQFEKGRHGFGINEVERDGEPYSWKEDFLTWLQGIL